MGPISHNQVNELRDTLERHNVVYLFIGKTGAILHGFPDTTQDADLFVQKARTNGKALTAALRDLGFRISDDQAQEIERGKDFIQLKNGPFDVDLVFAPDGIERFEDAWSRGRNIAGFPVCSIDDIIASKRASNRAKDREQNGCGIYQARNQREQGRNDHNNQALGQRAEKARGLRGTGHLETATAGRWCL
jgi:hypothetical protein